MSQSNIGKALPYCGYMFTGGPWKRALISFGVDPRTISEYRFYQTLIFNMELDPIVEQGKHYGLKSGNSTFPQFLRGCDGLEQYEYIGRLSDEILT